VDGATCADRLDCCPGIFDAGRGLDCNDVKSCAPFEVADSLEKAVPIGRPREKPHPRGGELQE
jgi:hypothetical protein